jgi:hypothetical protein
MPTAHVSRCPAPEYLRRPDVRRSSSTLPCAGRGGMAVARDDDNPTHRGARRWRSSTSDLDDCAPGRLAAGRASSAAFPTPPPLVPSSGSLGSAASPGQLSLACPPGVCVYSRPPPSLSSKLVTTHGLLKKVSIGLMHRLVAFTDVSNGRQLIFYFFLWRKTN